MPFSNTGAKALLTAALYPRGRARQNAPAHKLEALKGLTTLFSCPPRTANTVYTDGYRMHFPYTTHPPQPLVPAEEQQLVVGAGTAEGHAEPEAVLPWHIAACDPGLSNIVTCTLPTPSGGLRTFKLTTHQYYGECDVVAALADE